jgi:hypothetical protein
MKFVQKLRKLVESATPHHKPSGAVKFKYGCPKCALRIYQARVSEGEGWPTGEDETRPVKGIPSFSHQCRTCDTLWRISDPQDDRQGDLFMWYASYYDGSWHLFSVADCPDCHMTLSRYREHASGDREKDHTWCMNCGIEHNQGGSS